VAKLTKYYLFFSAGGEIKTAATNGGAGGTGHPPAVQGSSFFSTKLSENV
jgi:hypothetical protein